MVAPPPAAAELRDRDPRVRFLLELATALQRHGSAAHRLEGALEECARQLEVEARFFATPTSVFCAFGDLDDQRVRLLRVDVGEVHLGRLTDLYDLWGRVVGRPPLSAVDARARLRAVLAARDHVPVGVWWGSHAVASAAAAHFLGGGLPEVLSACLLGALVGGADGLRRRSAAVARVTAPLAAALAAAATTALARAVPVAIEPTLIAGIIVLVPGFTLTVAMAELAHGHLAAGTSRLLGAVMSFLTLGFGAAAGLQLGRLLPGAPLPPVPAAATPASLGAAVLAAALAFTVLFHARRRDAGWIVVACVVAFAGARLGSNHLGAELGVFTGALAVGALGNWLGRVRRTPSAVTTLPGIMVLVPGSLGLRSLTSLMQRETLVGIETAFSVVMVASALVTGLLIANLIVPARREL